MLICCQRGIRTFGLRTGDLLVGACVEDIKTNLLTAITASGGMGIWLASLGAGVGGTVTGTPLESEAIFDNLI